MAGRITGLVAVILPYLTISRNAIYEIRVTDNKVFTLISSNCVPLIHNSRLMHSSLSKHEMPRDSALCIVFSGTKEGGLRINRNS